MTIMLQNRSGNADKNEGVFMPGGGRREGTCDQGLGLSRMPPRVKPPTSWLVELKNGSEG